MRLLHGGGIGNGAANGLFFVQPEILAVSVMSMVIVMMRPVIHATRRLTRFCQRDQEPIAGETRSGCHLRQASIRPPGIGVAVSCPELLSRWTMPVAMGRSLSMRRSAPAPSTSVSASSRISAVEE